MIKVYHIYAKKLMHEWDKLIFFHILLPVDKNRLLMKCGQKKPEIKALCGFHKHIVDNRVNNCG